MDLTLTLTPTPTLTLTRYELGAAFGALLVEQHPDAPAALLDCLAPGGSPLQNANAAGALMNLAASSAAVSADLVRVSVSVRVRVRARVTLTRTRTRTRTLTSSRGTRSIG